MPKISDEQRKAVLELLAQGHDREVIATRTGVTPGQVSSVAAHVTMGTYRLPTPPPSQEATTESLAGRSESLLNHLRQSEPSPSRNPRVSPILLGLDAETGEQAFWHPDPNHGSPNPHVLVIGESGFGKTYTITCLLAELTRARIASFVLDYGQGFSLGSAPPEFAASTDPEEIHASRDGIDINPLQIFPSDVHGPVNVAQRVADTFTRVYPRIGIQQHAALRQAVLETFEDAGIAAVDPATWGAEPPRFERIHQKLLDYAANSLHQHCRTAGTVASHISTLFVYNTFRPSGRRFDWAELLEQTGSVHVIHLNGLENSLERAVTEFLLWNFIGFVESTGPSLLRCFVVLDEAHKLSFDRGSPVEKLLREGRKFGLGLILASQQPDDFSSVAFSNTATKVVFQVGDERGFVARQLHRRIRNAHSYASISELISKLPRGCAYVVSQNVGRLVHIASFADRRRLWQT